MGQAEGKEKIVIHADPELKEVIPGYLDNRKRDLEIIQEALKRNDFKTIRQLAHIMKGSGGGYGFDFITQIGASIEAAANLENTAAISKGIDEVTHYFKNLEIVYES